MKKISADYFNNLKPFEQSYINDRADIDGIQALKTIINEARKQYPDYVSIRGKGFIYLPNGEKRLWSGEDTRKFNLVENNTKMTKSLLIADLYFKLNPKKILGTEQQKKRGDRGENEFETIVKGSLQDALDKIDVRVIKPYAAYVEPKADDVFDASLLSFDPEKPPLIKAYKVGVKRGMKMILADIVNNQFISEYEFDRKNDKHYTFRHTLYAIKTNELLANLESDLILRNKSEFDLLKTEDYIRKEIEPKYGSIERSKSMYEEAKNAAWSLAQSKKYLNTHLLISIDYLKERIGNEYHIAKNVEFIKEVNDWLGIAIANNATEIAKAKVKVLALALELEFDLED